MDYIALKTEIALPAYNGLTDAQIIAAINAKNRTQIKRRLTGDEIFQATDETNFINLTDAKRNLWLSFCARSEINPGASGNIAFLRYVFGAGSATETALVALRSESVSRAQELGLPPVNLGDLIKARLS